MHSGIIALRKVLSIESEPPIQEVIDTGIVPLLKDFLLEDQEPQLQLEAAWCLTNIASGTTDQSKVVADNRGIELLIRLLTSNNSEGAEQAVWALGNLISLYQKIKSKLSSKHVIWAISNCCRGKPKPSYSLTSKALSTLVEAVKTSVDAEVLTDAIWALSYLIGDGQADPTNGINEAIKLGLLEAMTNLIQSPLLSIVIPTIRILGNLAAAQDNSYIDEILKYPIFIDTLAGLITHAKRAIRKETSWCLSNLVAGTPAQSIHILNHPTLIDNLFKQASSECIEVLKEMAYVILSLNDTCTFEEIVNLNKKGQLQFLSLVFSKKEAPVVEVGLEGLQKILNKARAVGPDAEQEIKDSCVTYGLLAQLKTLVSTEFEPTVKTTKAGVQAQDKIEHSGSKANTQAEW
eukprot:CAMPEP_0176442708 /NCGR_PEP_ID=MMETSP0127-20121128/21986_1 /TAXON_ID=938130 /ORGANISM="Platyophrya macrostoma, Strain WH" /LENGTH=404 /DNA_ID=CAMNT_0017827793 /DNA_START=236 /DNA_END=1447 /DNA_ORIENTATION=+